MTITPPHGPRPPPTVRAELTGDVRQLAHLRRQCARTFTGVPEAVVGDVQLVVTELAANALHHTARHTGTVLVRQDPTDIHIAVSDTSSIPPRVLHDALVGGRGIQIVAALARTWGVVRQRSGKTVWADIAINP